jgi:hypothetical protein
LLETFMKPRFTLSWLTPAARRSVLFAVVAMITCAGQARASSILTIGSLVASSPSSNNAFDVTLTNTGPAALTIGGFSFGISVSDPHVVFTSVTTSTVSPYVFDGQSLFGPNIDTAPAGQSAIASDLFAVFGSGTTIGAGVTVGLGHVLFNILPGASGPIPVTFISAQTSLSDALGNNLTVNSLVGGTITVPGASVPEPASLMLLGLGLAPLATARARAFVRKHLS